MSIKTELLELQKTGNDMLHCKEVLEWARTHPASALHSRIEWDNSKAADGFRLSQVRRLIEIHISLTGTSPVVVSLSVDRKAGGGYRSLADVASRPDLAAILLQDALDELERMQGRYSRIKALSPVWREAEAVRRKTGDRRKRAA